MPVVPGAGSRRRVKAAPLRVRHALLTIHPVLITPISYPRLSPLDRDDYETPRAVSRLTQAVDQLRSARATRASDDDIGVAQTAVVDARFAVLEAQRSTYRMDSAGPAHTPMSDADTGLMVSVYA